jgi:hypothetical protein
MLSEEAAIRKLEILEIDLDYIKRCKSQHFSKDILAMYQLDIDIKQAKIDAYKEFLEVQDAE